MSTDEIVYELYSGEHQLEDIARLISPEQSEPYSMYTYRQFVVKYPEYCFVAKCNDKLVGVILTKLDRTGSFYGGYIGMLVVDPAFRGRRIAKTLVKLSIKALSENPDVQFAIMETEVHNIAALTLYEQLGFSRTELLPRYYLNNSDAFRLKFWLQPPVQSELNEATTEG